MIFDLVRDFAATLNQMPGKHPRRRILKLLDEAIRRDAQFISQHPTTLFQCLWNTCWWYDCPDAEKHYEASEDGDLTGRLPWNQPGPRLHKLLELMRTERAKSITGRPWLRSLRPGTQLLGTAMQSMLRGHDRTVSCIAISPDGQRIVSGSIDQTVRIWESDTGRELVSFEAQHGPVLGVAISPNGRWIASVGGGAKMLRLSEIESGAELVSVHEIEDGAWSICFLDDCHRVAVGTAAGSLRIVDIQAGCEISRWLGHTEPVVSIALFPDSKRLVTASFDKTVRVWDSESGVQQSCMIGHEGGVYGVACSPDGRQLASASSDRTIRLWSVETGEVEASLNGHDACVTSVAYSSDGRLASASHDGTVRIWDAAKAVELACLYGHDGRVMSVAFTPGSRHVISAGNDQTIRVWEVDAACDGATPRKSPQVDRRAFADNRRQFAAAYSDNTVALWSFESGALLSRFKGHADVVECLEFCPTGQLLASASRDGTVRCWDSQSFSCCAELTAQQLGSSPSNPSRILRVRFSPNGHQIALGTDRGTVLVWDVKTQSEVARLTHPYHGSASGIDDVYGIAFTPDGEQLAAGLKNRNVIIWDVASERERVCLRGHQGQVLVVRFSPDGKWLASGSTDRTVRVWDVGIGVERRLLSGHTGSVTGLAFSLDGSRLLSQSRSEQTTRSWDIITGRCLEVYPACGDLSAAAEGSRRFPYDAHPLRIDSIVEAAQSHVPVSWFPDRFYRVAVDESGLRWAGLHRGGMYHLQLDGISAGS